MHHGEACALYLQTNQNVSRAGFESVVLIAQLVRAEAHVWLSTCQLELNTGRWFESSSRHIFNLQKMLFIAVAVVGGDEVRVVHDEAGEVAPPPRLHEARVEQQAPVEQIVSGLQKNK